MRHWKKGGAALLAVGALAAVAVTASVARTSAPSRPGSMRTHASVMPPAAKQTAATRLTRFKAPSDLVS